MFVTLSSHGVYYRHRIDSRAVPGRPERPLSPVESFEQPVIDSVFQVPVAELIASNRNELVAKLNENVAAVNPGTIVIVLSCCALFLVAVAPIAALVLFVVGLVCGVVLFSHFRAAHIHEINYSLDSQAAERFSATQSALSSLFSCHRLWTLNTKTPTSDQRRNAGAGSLITRKPTSAGSLPTPGFKTSLPISSFSANGTVFHFLPDQILLFSGGRYATIDYGNLSVEVESTRFIETEGVPRDSTQVGTTWRFVNKDGGPDRRFNNNVQIPVLQYGEVVLRTASGLQVVIQASSLDKARTFGSHFRARPARGSAPDEQESRKKTEDRFTSPSRLLECYSLLGITRPCTAEQAANAHRVQASLYHPDKYEHLAPEMKALALKRMQDINAAYESIKLDIRG